MPAPERDATTAAKSAWSSMRLPRPGIMRTPGVPRIDGPREPGRRGSVGGQRVPDVADLRPRSDAVGVHAEEDGGLRGGEVARHGASVRGGQGTHGTSAPFARAPYPPGPRRTATGASIRGAGAEEASASKNGARRGGGRNIRRPLAPMRPPDCNTDCNTAPRWTARTAWQSPSRRAVRRSRKPFRALWSDGGSNPPLSVRRPKGVEPTGTRAGCRVLGTMAQAPGGHLWGRPTPLSPGAIRGGWGWDAGSDVTRVDPAFTYAIIVAVRPQKYA